jgi:hypothetical protein
MLQAIFNDGQTIPEWMKKSRLTALSKTGNPACKLDDIRPIAMFGDCTKLLETMIMEKLEAAAHEGGLPVITSCPKYQTGFKQASGCDLNQVRVARFISSQNAKNAPWFVACYDMKKAFDSIDRGLLFKHLREAAQTRQCQGEE